MRKTLVLAVATVVVVYLVVYAIGAGASGRSATGMPDAKGQAVIDKVSRLDVPKTTIEDIKKLLGEPQQYLWGHDTFTKDNLPNIYIMAYPGDVHVVIDDNEVMEVRFEGPGYNYKGIKYGTKLDDAIRVLGAPSSTVVGEKLAFAQGVLYRDADGTKGYCYYDNGSVRVFFADYKVHALYIKGTSGRCDEKPAGPPSPLEAAVLEKVGTLDFQSATLSDVFKVLGEPTGYIWGNDKFTKDNLPSRYIMQYPGGVDIVVCDGTITEFRFYKPGYSYKGLQVGSSVEDAIMALGEPSATVTGQKLEFEEGVLYRDIDDTPGYCYYQKGGVRLFFSDYKLNALYVLGARG